MSIGSICVLKDRLNVNSPSSSRLIINTTLSPVFAPTHRQGSSRVLPRGSSGHVPTCLPFPGNPHEWTTGRLRPSPTARTSTSARFVSSPGPAPPSGVSRTCPTSTGTRGPDAGSHSGVCRRGRVGLCPYSSPVPVGPGSGYRWAEHTEGLGGGSPDNALSAGVKDYQVLT